MTLDHWLAYIEKQHPADIELGLGRVQHVYANMRLAPSCPVITVAGTNGKGSSVAMLASILGAAGYCVGSYTSPHLVQYNERVVINAVPADDAMLCAGFEAVDAARGDIPLTYFEYGTLCAFWCFAQVELDVWILEVGLGGRLDAVNIIDADVALITRIGLDHQNWLGEDRELIGQEKAGIMRTGQPAVCSDPQPPASIKQQAKSRGARLLQLGVDYAIENDRDSWSWQSAVHKLAGLPYPALAGKAQLDNAAGVIAVLELAALPFSVDRPALDAGLRGVHVAGRFQSFAPGELMPAMVIVDVAHNADSACLLAQSLADQPVSGKTLAVWSMYQDKDRHEVVRLMQSQVDSWYIAAMNGPRATPCEQLEKTLDENGVTDAHRSAFVTVEQAYSAAAAAAGPDDRLVVFGSFELAGVILAQVDTGTGKRTGLNA